MGMESKTSYTEQSREEVSGMGKEKSSGKDNLCCHIPDDCYGSTDEKGEFPRVRLVYENGLLRVEEIQEQELQESVSDL